MWCDACQQDVPGISSPEDASRVCCARCRKPAASDSARSLYGAGPASDAAFSEFATTESAGSRDFGEPVPFDLNDWQFEENLRAAERLCRRVGVTSHSDATQPRWRTVDPPHAAIPPRHKSRATETPGRRSEKIVRPQKRPRGKSSWMAWIALSLGLMTFACGAVLLVWSFVGNRTDLWRIGLPLTLAGQAALVVGLVLQLDVLWQSTRDTTDTLDQLDDQLSDLRHTTTLLGSTHSSAAQSFYVHMAEGASPELLLADLKGQLDLLAMKMSRER